MFLLLPGRFYLQSECYTYAMLFGFLPFSVQRKLGPISEEILRALQNSVSNDEQQQENAEEQEEENVEEEHLEAPPPLIATGQDLEVSRQQLLTLLSNKQGIQEVLLYKPLGQTETVGEFFGVASSADFKQKLSHLFHLLRGFTMDKIFVLIRFQNPRTFRFYFSHLKRLLFPFFTILQTILTGEDHGSLNRQCIFTLSTNGNRCVSYELTKHGRQYNIGQPEWPIVVYSPYSV